MSAIRPTHGIDYLHGLFLAGRIRREVMDDLIDYVQTFSVYEGMVGKQIALGLSEDKAHEAVIEELIKGV